LFTANVGGIALGKAIWPAQPIVCCNQIWEDAVAIIPAEKKCAR